jgi:hypothetical protein
MTTAQKFRTGNVHVEAMHLTEQTGPAVWEWADSKPYFSPEGDGLTITGLRVYTPTGDAKAEFGDWVVRYAEGFYPVKADVFAERFQPAS